MNIHHLELYYYVAKSGGISEAVRRIPYGIQQPAVSAQILQLEDSLGVTLFQRRPFCLTPAGERLYRYIQPFFENLDSIAGELRGTAGSIRLGAPEAVLRNHMPEVLRRLKGRFPKIKVHLREDMFEVRNSCDCCIASLMLIADFRKLGDRAVPVATSLRVDVVGG